MILRVFFRVYVCSLEGLDNFLHTSDDAKTYPQGPKTFLKQSQI